MKFSPNLPVILSFALLTACSATKDMNQMSKTTQAMAAKTSSMADTTQHLAVTNDSVLTEIGQTNATAKDTDNSVKQSTAAVQMANVQTTRIANAEELILQGGRPPATKKTRSDAIRAMETAKDIREKINEAGAYFAAFEYQAWTGVELDTQDELDVLKDAAMKEFTRELGEYLPSPDDMKKTDVTSKDDKMLNLYALSAAAQEKYENAIPGTKSMLDLIQDTLKLNSDAETKKEVRDGLKPWQSEILANYSELVYFLQIRTSFLAALALGKLTNIATLSDGDIEKDMIFGWKMDLSPANGPRIDFGSTVINGAIAEGLFLKSINEPARIDNTIRTLLTKAIITDTSSHATEDERKATVLTFKSAVQGFLTLQ